MSQFHFQQLTPDCIHDLLASVGFWPQRGLLALNSYENRVYQFIHDDNQRYVLKVYRPQRWSDAQILEEHAFCQELAADEIPALVPLTINGQTLHHFQDYRFALYPSVGGRHAEVDNFDQLERIGQYLGRLHACGAQKGFHQRAQLQMSDFALYRAELQQSPCIPEGLKSLLDTVMLQCQQLLPQQTLPTLRLHGDCHAGNILFRDDVTLLDFDDCQQGPAIADLWMLLSGENNEQREQLEVLLEGYELFYPFDVKQLTWIEPLRCLRMARHLAWIAKRWQDPAFPQSFPYFDEPRYWEQQILNFKAQLANLQQAPLTLTAY